MELAFAWLLAHPEVSSVIAGATTPQQISANARAADWRLSPAEMEALDGILRALPTLHTPTAHLLPFRPWWDRNEMAISSNYESAILAQFR